jgi:hypothetical protein
MTMYTVVVMYFDGKQPVEVAESVDLAAMLQLAGLICQHAIAEVSSVEVWEGDWLGATRVTFSWLSEGAIDVQEEGYFSSTSQLDQR